jgi:hypothetical protein
VYRFDPESGQKTELSSERLFVVGLHDSDVLVRGNECGGGFQELCLYAIPKQGGARRSLLAGKPASYESQYVGDHMYWVLDGGDLAAAHRTHLVTGADEILFGAKYAIDTFDTDGTWALTVASNSGGFLSPRVVTRLDRSSPAIQIGQGANPSYGGVVFSGNYVYWYRTSGADLPQGTSSFERLELGKANVEPIATLPVHLYGVAKIHGDTVYFRHEDHDAFTQAYFRMPLAGGNLEQIATFRSGTALVDWHVTDDALYVARSTGADGVVVEIALP